MERESPVKRGDVVVIQLKKDEKCRVVSLVGEVSGDVVKVILDRGMGIGMSLKPEVLRRGEDESKYYTSMTPIDKQLKDR